MNPVASFEHGPARNVLRMIADLHVRGYQRLRMIPGVTDPGYWRCGITPASNVRPDHGALALDMRADLVPQYSIASGRRYFDWEDAGHATPSGLARRFIDCFPSVAKAGYGSDWTYVGWYAEMLHLTYPDDLPVAWGQYTDASSHLPVLSAAAPNRMIPLPPLPVRRGD